MDLEQVLDLVKELKEIVAALAIAIPLVVKFWQDAKAKTAELKAGGVQAAAEDLYHLGEELKDDWKAAGKKNKDLASRLRALAPGLLAKYGVSKGVSEEDIQKVLGLGFSIHKARKTAKRAWGGSEAPGSVVNLVLPSEPDEPEEAPDPPKPSGE